MVEEKKGMLAGLQKDGLTKRDFDAGRTYHWA
jgi:hypothetical protein